MNEAGDTIKEPLTGIISAVVPKPVRDAVLAEAKAKERSVSWVASRIFIDWYRKQPGAQVEMELVVPRDGGGGR